MESKTWQGIKGCTEACRAQIRGGEKPYLWVDGAICLTGYSRLNKTKPWQGWVGAGSTPALGKRLLWVTTGGVFQPVSLWLASLYSKESNLFLWSSILKICNLTLVLFPALRFLSPHELPLTPWAPEASVQCGCAPAAPGSQIIYKILQNSTVWFHLGHCPVTPVFQSLLWSIPMKHPQLDFSYVMWVCFKDYPIVFFWGKNQ